MEIKESTLRKELAELNSRLEDSNIYTSKEYPRLARRRSELQEVIDLFDQKISWKPNLKPLKS